MQFWNKNKYTKSAFVGWIITMVSLVVFVILMVSATNSYAVASAAAIFGLIFVLSLFTALMTTVLGSVKND